MMVIALGLLTYGIQKLMNVELHAVEVMENTLLQDLDIKKYD